MIVIGSMSFLKLFCYHLPMRGRAGVKLGDADSLRRIYNFWCSMLDYISVPHVLTMFLYHFGMIYGTNLLTRFPVPVPVFCYRFVSEKLFWEVSRIALIIYRNYFQYETKMEPDGHPEGSPRGSRRHLAVAPLRPHLDPTWVGGPPPRVASSPINSLLM